MKLAKRLKALLPAFLLFRFELRALHVLEKKIELGRPPNTREAEECGAIKCYRDEMSDVYQSRRSLITNNYRRITQKLSVPMPDRNDGALWEDVENDMLQYDVRCLTTSGERAIKLLIREEQKHRREAVGYWFGILVGLIGAITGLVSVFKS